jgi:hypothetical protein
MLGCSKGDAVTQASDPPLAHLLLVTLRATTQAGIGTRPNPGSLDPQPRGLDPRPTLLRSGAAAY